MVAKGSTESNGLNLFSRIRGIVEQGLYLFVIFSSSRFLQKKNISSIISLTMFEENLKIVRHKLVQTPIFLAQQLNMLMFIG